MHCRLVSWVGRWNGLVFNTIAEAEKWIGEQGATGWLANNEGTYIKAYVQGKKASPEKLFQLE